MKYKKWFVGFSLLLVLAAAAVMVTRGFNVGIEFTGGTVVEVGYDQRPEIEIIKNQVALLGINGDVQPIGETGVIIRSRDLGTGGQESLLAALTIDNHVPVIDRLDEVGPSIGKELRTKAFLALGIVALAIIIFVAYAFRHVSRPISSWNYGLAAVLALLHDVMIPAGIFALIGGEVNSLFVVGLLSILGLSVNDTIVVFDRIREGLRQSDRDIEKPGAFETLVGTSIKSTMARSINTSLTLVVVLAALWIVGPAATQGLALVMLFGIVTGTYSSIFLASPLLVLMNKRRIANLSQA